jgi:hypothetical protein
MENNALGDSAERQLEHLKQHEGFVCQLNEKGCEFGRKTMTELKNVEDDYKSYFKSVKAGQELFANEIFPKMQEGVREAKEVAKDANSKIEKSEKIAGDCKDILEDYKKDMAKWGWGIIGSLLLMVAATIWGSATKLYQDNRNQVETAAYLASLTRTMTALEQRLNTPPQQHIR